MAEIDQLSRIEGMVRVLLEHVSPFIRIGEIKKIVGLKTSYGCTRWLERQGIKPAAPRLWRRLDVINAAPSKPSKKKP